MFLWIKTDISANFRINLHETVKIVVITNPRPQLLVFNIQITQNIFEMQFYICIFFFFLATKSTTPKPHREDISN